MLIIDEKKTIHDSKNFDKTAAILGFSIFGKDHRYLVKEEKSTMNSLNEFFEKYSNTSCLIFGFTSYIYEYLLKKNLEKKFKGSFSNSILIHGGGWKKMEKIKISEQNFKRKLEEKHKIKNVINYYGLIEQTGSIFFECEMWIFFSKRVFRGANKR